MQALLNVKRRKNSIKKADTAKKPLSIKSKVAKDVYNINFKNFELPEGNKRVLKDRSRKTFIQPILNLKFCEGTKLNKSLNSHIRSIENNDNIKIEESATKTESERISIRSYKININQENEKKDSVIKSKSAESKEYEVALIDEEEKKSSSSESSDDAPSSFSSSSDPDSYTSSKVSINKDFLNADADQTQEILRSSGRANAIKRRSNINSIRDTIIPDKNQGKKINKRKTKSFFANNAFTAMLNELKIKNNLMSSSRNLKNK